MCFEGGCERACFSILSRMTIVSTEKKTEFENGYRLISSCKRIFSHAQNGGGFFKPTKVLKSLTQQIWHKRDLTL